MRSTPSCSTSRRRSPANRLSDNRVAGRPPALLRDKGPPAQRRQQADGLAAVPWTTCVGTTRCSGPPAIRDSPTRPSWPSTLLLDESEASHKDLVIRLILNLLAEDRPSPGHRTAVFRPLEQPDPGAEGVRRLPRRSPAPGAPPPDHLGVSRISEPRRSRLASDQAREHHRARSWRRTVSRNSRMLSGLPRISSAPASRAACSSG